jgi:hypothetical protein
LKTKKTYFKKCKKNTLHKVAQFKKRKRKYIFPRKKKIRNETIWFLRTKEIHFPHEGQNHYKDCDQTRVHCEQEEKDEPHQEMQNCHSHRCQLEETDQK